MYKYVITSPTGWIVLGLMLSLCLVYRTQGARSVVGTCGLCVPRPVCPVCMLLCRVELVPEPPKGWCIVVKIGPHWARSNIRCR